MKQAQITLIALAMAYFAIAAYPSLKHGICLLQYDVASTPAQRIDAIMGDPVCPKP